MPLFLVVGPGAPSSVPAPSSDALVPSSFSFLVVFCFLFIFSDALLIAKPRSVRPSANEDAARCGAMHRFKPERASRTKGEQVSAYEASNQIAMASNLRAEDRPLEGWMI